MAAPTLTERRPEIFLAVLLSVCLVTLSLQVRRPGGRTVGEGWLLTAVSPFVDLVTSVRSGVHEVGTWAASRRALRVENRALTDEVARLRGELLRLRDAEEDKGRLLELFGAQPSPPGGTIPARLIAVESSGPFRTALLDRGASDGLRVDGVVVARGGLLGRVIALGPKTARIQLLSDNTAAVGVLLMHGTRGRMAVAKGDGKGGVSIEYVPTIEPVEPNDTLVSSGTDGLYPGSLPVGRIASVHRNKTLFWEIQVAAAADPHGESLVFVLPPVRKSDVTSGPSVVERR
ncbi:MAG TPA: rod shape-determining protein MreC [Thermoanaerobaculia bacterium]|nr:rod shape-determining protein MreC [Thermoanaerobaculia bacterium]